MRSARNEALKLKVMHCAETARGGIATYLDELLPLQIESMGLTSVLCILPDRHVRDVESVPASIFAPFRSGNSRIFNTFMLMVTVLVSMFRFKPDVVHIHSTFAGIAVRPMLFFFKGVRVVYCPHGWSFDRSSSKFTTFLCKLVERILSPFCHVIICISQHEFDIAKRAGVAVSKLFVVHNGIADIGVLDRGSEESLWPSKVVTRILFVGRFDRQKGVDVLCEALRILGGEFHALLVGDSVLSVASNFDFPDNSTSPGWLPRNRLQHLYGMAHVLVIPSRWEGFGMISVEAMRAGCPVVASKVGGLVEIIDDGVTGVLVPPEDAVALASAIRSLDAEQLRTMGRAGRARYLQFYDSRRMWSGILDAYRS